MTKKSKKILHNNQQKATLGNTDLSKQNAVSREQDLNTIQMNAAIITDLTVINQLDDKQPPLVFRDASGLTTTIDNNGFGSLGSSGLTSGLQLSSSISLPIVTLDPAQQELVKQEIKKDAETILGEDKNLLQTGLTPSEQNIAEQIKTDDDAIITQNNNNGTESLPVYSGINKRFALDLALGNQVLTDDGATIVNLLNDQGAVEALETEETTTTRKIFDTAFSLSNPANSLEAARELVQFAQAQYDDVVTKIGSISLPSQLDTATLAGSRQVLSDAQNLLSMVETETGKKSVIEFVNALNSWYTKPCDHKALNTFKNLFACEINVQIYLISDVSPPPQGLFWTLIGNVNRASLIDLFKTFLIRKKFTTDPFSSSIPYKTIVYIPNPHLVDRYVFDITLTTDLKNKITSIVLAQYPFHTE